MSTGHTVRRTVGLFAFALAAVGAVLLIRATDAEAAPECCKITYSADGKTMYISGYVSYRGKLLYMSVGGRKCLAKAGDNRAFIKSTIPTKLMPNGRHEITIVSKVNGKVRYSTQYFTITDSPAVAVEIKAPQADVVKAAPVTIKLGVRGVVKSRSCTLDGSPVRCPADEVELQGLSDGAHVFKVTVDGSDGYSSSAAKSFTLDTEAPSPPEVDGADGEWTNDSVVLRAGGSTDAGTGVQSYQWQRSVTAGSTWERLQEGREAVVNRQGETHFRFRALDGAGRASSWVDAVTRIDSTPPQGQPTLGVTSGDPCTGSYPVALTASGGTDTHSGVETYVFSIIGYLEDGTREEREETATSVTLQSPGDYYVIVWIVDAAGNQSEEGLVWRTSEVCA